MMATGVCLGMMVVSVGSVCRHLIPVNISCTRYLQVNQLLIIIMSWYLIKLTLKSCWGRSRHCSHCLQRLDGSKMKEEGKDVVVEMTSTWDQGRRKKEGRKCQIRCEITPSATWQEIPIKRRTKTLVKTREKHVQVHKFYVCSTSVLRLEVSCIKRDVYSEDEWRTDERTLEYPGELTATTSGGRKEEGEEQVLISYERMNTSLILRRSLSQDCVLHQSCLKPWK